MDISNAKDILESAFEMAEMNKLAETALIRFINAKIARRDLEELEGVLEMFSERHDISPILREKLVEVAKIKSRLKVASRD